MLERNFQGKLIKRIKDMFPGALVLKNDATYIQGIPDLTIFYKSKWAMLECKKTVGASKRPNQQYYINKVNDMSFGAFISPENEEETLNELKSFFFS